MSGKVGYSPERVAPAGFAATGALVVRPGQNWVASEACLPGLDCRHGASGPLEEAVEASGWFDLGILGVLGAHRNLEGNPEAVQEDPGRHSVE